MIKPSATKTTFLITFVSIVFLYSCRKPATKVLLFNKHSVENISTTDIITAVVLCSCDSSNNKKTQVLSNINPGEIRNLDTTYKNCSITQIRSAYYNELPDSDYFKTGVKAMALLLTGVVTLFGSIIIYRYQKSNKSSHEIEILISEAHDIKRHVEANLGWIEQMKEHSGVPLDFFLKRLNTWDKLIMNTPDTYRTIPKKYTKILAKARLLVRNLDIESESLLNYMRNGKVNPETLKAHVNFIESKHRYMRDWFTLAIAFFKMRKPNFEKFAIKENELKDKYPSKMIFEQPLPSVIEKNKLDIRTRDNAEISLENFIIMPPFSKASDAGINILHMNTKTSPYTNNQSAKHFIEELKQTASPPVSFYNDSTTLKFAVEKAMEINLNGLFLEFGFCSGTSLNFIAALAFDRKVYAFDSLQGLRKNWRTGFDANVFSYKNKDRFPFVPLANTSLVIGWIEDTLPLFKQYYLQNNPVAFMHIDSDSYESAWFVLNELKDNISIGNTIIVLDEGYNFSDSLKNNDDEWRKHEYSAVNEFAKANNLSIKYLAFNQNHQQLVLTFIHEADWKTELK